MKFMIANRHIAGIFVCVLGLTGMSGVAYAAPDDFAHQMSAAMIHMDHDMMVPPSGNADRDFATMMIPHHRGAIEMAEAELRFGHDSVLRRLAQGILVEQRQEIAVMQQSLASLPPASPHADPHVDPHAGRHMEPTK